MRDATPARTSIASLGANVGTNGTTFRVWAPAATRLDLVVEGVPGAGHPDTLHPMTPDADGYHSLVVGQAPAGTLYRYRPDGQGPFPDPASRWQPYGVHGPSAVIDPASFAWSDATWTGVPLVRTVLYELHVGTFTPEGTFEGARARLPYLAELGITAVQVMPIADFPGRWNWGYDGVAPFAPARCYGTPDDFRRFVDAAHATGLAVHLDVVYNHLGPDGAYQAAFSPYFYSAMHSSPWGAGINFDGPHSDAVRGYVIENACRWIDEFHVDGLRLDATHAITDTRPRHVLAELADAVRARTAGSGREVIVIAEDERNLDTIVRTRAEGGWQLDGVWADDFHHHLRRALAGDSDGYFADFDGRAASIAATARQGWFFTGQRSAYSGEHRGTNPEGIPLERCVICLQNHDQVGNRAFGERLHHQIPPEAWRAASTLLLMLPETPLLFMGQEWAASTPFLYFTDHEPDLGTLVTEGRRREFARFKTFSDPATRASIPDPQADSTFTGSALDWSEREREPHASVHRLYQALLALRASLWPAPADTEVFDACADGDATVLVRRACRGSQHVLAVVRLQGSGRVSLSSASLQPPPGQVWGERLSTEDPRFATDAAPPDIDGDGTAVTFRRPGAVVFVSAAPLGEEAP